MRFKTILLLCFFSVSVFAKTEKPFFTEEDGLEGFVDQIEKAESFYDPDFSCCNFKKELIVLDQFYKYKNICDATLNDFALGKNELTQQERKIVEEKYLPLTTEIIRHLEAHLMNVHGWRPTMHFSNIAKPVVFGSGLIISTVVVAKLLETFGLISKKSFRDVSVYSSASGLGLILLWITYNYRDVICKRDKSFDTRSKATHSSLRRPA